MCLPMGGREEKSAAAVLFFVREADECVRRYSRIQALQDPDGSIPAFLRQDRLKLFSSRWIHEWTKRLL